MFTLIAMGVSATYVFSVVATLAPQIFPAGFRDAHGNVGVYYEAAAVIVVLVLLGQMLELRARERSEEHTSELQSLMRISYAVFFLKKKKTKYHNRITQKQLCLKENKY